MGGGGGGGGAVTVKSRNKVAGVRHLPWVCHYPVSYEEDPCYPICEGSSLEIGAGHLCSVKEIAPKSAFLCVKRSHIRYSFRVRH